MQQYGEPTPRLWLAPASSRGWFGGEGILADGAEAVRSGVSLAEAAEALEAVFDGVEPGLVAVLAHYEGDCTVVHFPEWDKGEAPSSVDGERATSLLQDAAWDLSGRDYRAAIAEAKERIAAGDVYVVNLTARLVGRLNEGSPPLGLSVAEDAFRRLYQRARGDMSALFEGLPGTTSWIASVSPERFLRVRRDSSGGRCAEIHPIKGTAPRGADEASDQRNACQLARDHKERAEHVMVVDLERNDLGMCCVPGTVRVEPMFEVVETPYCHQLVSQVSGDLRPDVVLAQLLDATFPCGSITGAPKRSAVSLIAELEREPRGAYCGALFVARRDDLDSSVLIRTLEAGAGEAGMARWGAGCGITIESVATREHLELLLKASPVIGDGVPATGLRETIRASQSHAPLIDRHLARLASGGVGRSVLAQVALELDRALQSPIAAAPYARIGVTVAHDGGVAIDVSDRPSTLAVEGGPHIAPVVIDALPQLPEAAAKPLDRALWDEAHRVAALAGADQALLITRTGVLVDGSTATVWLRDGSRLLTPPAPPAVAGVARELVFDLAGSHGLEPIEVELTIDDFWDADDVWLSNALAGFVRARRVEFDR